MISKSEVVVNAKYVHNNYMYYVFVNNMLRYYRLLDDLHESDREVTLILEVIYEA